MDIAREQARARRTIGGIVLTAVLSFGLVIGAPLATAAPADAAWTSKTTQYEHKPKRWHCVLWSWTCSRTSHQYCGNPSIAYTYEYPCYHWHWDYY